MTRRIGIGVIGFGWMGQAHSRGARRAPAYFTDRLYEPELVVVSDTVEERRDDAVRSFGFASAVTDWREVVEHPDVDVVFVTAPNMLPNWLGPLVENPRLLMAVMMVVLVLIGTALDLTPTILIFAPVMLPIAVKAGIDPVYFGLMFILNGAIGLITPPVGTVLNVVAGVGRLPMHQVIKGVNPFLLSYTLVLALFVLFPQIVTAPVAWMR